MEWQKLVVKSTKLLLMVNVSPNGALDNDKMVKALLTQRNTPNLDAECH